MGHIKIPMTGKYGTGKHLVIDAEDLPLIEGKRIYVNEHGYARISANGGKVYVHRLVMPDIGGLEIDHINHNKLDNRKANLRLVTRQQNIQNRPTWGTTSEYYGVSLEAGKRWRAGFYLNGKRTRKYYPTEIEAARGYDEMVKASGSTHTPLNFPDK